MSSTRVFICSGYNGSPSSQPRGSSLSSNIKEMSWYLMTLDADIWVLSKFTSYLGNDSNFWSFKEVFYKGSFSYDYLLICAWNDKCQSKIWPHPCPNLPDLQSCRYATLLLLTSSWKWKGFQTWANALGFGGFFKVHKIYLKAF